MDSSLMYNWERGSAVIDREAKRPSCSVHPLWRVSQRARADAPFPFFLQSTIVLPSHRPSRFFTDFSG
jgi:hypothetical protein